MVVATVVAMVEGKDGDVLVEVVVVVNVKIKHRFAAVQGPLLLSLKYIRPSPEKK